MASSKTASSKAYHLRTMGYHKGMAAGTAANWAFSLLYSSDIQIPIFHKSVLILHKRVAATGAKRGSSLT